MDPQNSGPNWSLCRDIESSVATELSVFAIAEAADIALEVFIYRLSKVELLVMFSGLALGFCCDIL